MRRACIIIALLVLPCCADEEVVEASQDSGADADTLPVADGERQEPHEAMPPPGPLSYAPCALGERVGGFEVTRAEAYTGVNGQVADGVVPGNVPSVVSAAGDCRLLQVKPLFCDPPCVPGETCGPDGGCISYPENQSVGVVTVEGLKSPLAMEAKWGNHYTNPGSLEHPAYETGSELVLVAAGGDLESFALRGVGVAALEPTGGTVAVDLQEDVEVTWVPSGASEAVRVHLELNINNHGTTSAWIACDAEDTGSAPIPGQLVAELYAIGVSGFPSLEAERRTVESTQLSVGCVEFEVVSPASLPVEVGGVVSCTGDGQCPPGQTCGVDLQCQ